ncbi:lysoplasmalogenase [Solitalea sp. MAHUQ-68]|uniref:Lysoplasmalogenase n=1 Tax=Solitalea agri TaxID=2953739 RepID=A0A9X2F3Z3_9SPHI|nr:lysoplasmalogenase [Solitalea agri]MCO4293871.1 lysoplasmalogenase [Solitalea agri]
MKRVLTILFFLSVILTIAANYLQFIELRYIAKPLIMVFLAWIFSLNTNEQNQPIRRITYLAFLFSWLGDIALLFADDSSKAPGFYFFIAGLISFLTAHVCYIIVFRRIAKRILFSGVNKNKLFLGIPVLIVAGILIFKIIPHLGPMMAPVIVYAIVISTMAIAAIALQGGIETANFNAIYIGAALFLISDTTLAVNQFVSPSATLGIVVMITYGFAQYFIMQGLSSLQLRQQVVEKVI